MKTLSIACFSVLLTACHSERLEINPPSPPADYMVCAELPVAPDLRPLEAITLPDGRVVYLKADVDARDGPIARYIVAVRGAWFDCSNAVQRVRDYYEAAE